MSTAVCLNSSTIRPTPLMEKIRIAGAVGYAGIELWSDDLSAHVEAGGTLDEVNRALKDAGLRVPTLIALHGWLGSQGVEHQQALDEARRRMDWAVAVGAERIIASPPLESCDLSRGGEQYRELLELGAECGVRPAMEFLGFVDSVFTIEQAWAIVTAAGCADASIVMDPFHILRGGGSVEAISDVPGDSVAIWHWNDVPAGKPVREQTDADRLMPGEGIGPLQQIERRARAAGYDGAVSLELFNPELWKRDPETVAREGMAHMRRYFQP